MVVQNSAHGCIIQELQICQSPTPQLAMGLLSELKVISSISKIESFTHNDLSYSNVKETVMGEWRSPALGLVFLNQTPCQPCALGQWVGFNYFLSFFYHFVYIFERVGGKLLKKIVIEKQIDLIINGYSMMLDVS